MNISLKRITFKGIEFDTDTITVKFNNSQFILDTLSDIKDIQIPIAKNIFDNIDKTLIYLDSIGSTSIDELIGLLNEYKTSKDLFFTNLFKEKN